MSDNRTNDAGGTSIAEAIKVHKTLTNMNLSSNGVSDVGATYIAEAIRIDQMLTNLNLRHNGCYRDEKDSALLFRNIA